MGHEDRRRPGARRGSPARPRGRSRAGWRRARRTARRAGSGAGGRRARGRGRPAAAARPRADGGSGRRDPASPTISSSSSDTAPRRSAAGQTEADVGLHRQVREQAALLGHVSDARRSLGADVRVAVVERPRRRSRPYPRSGRSKPARIRSRVVLPLPDWPDDRGERSRRARRDPRPRSTGWVPNDLCRSVMTQICGRIRHLRPRGAGRQSIKIARDHVAGDGSDRDDHQRKRRGLAVGQVLLVGPELGRQRLGTGRDQQQGRGQLGERRQEHQAEGGREPRTDQRQGDAPEHRRRPAPRDRAASSSPTGAWATDGADRRPARAGRTGSRRRRPAARRSGTEPGRVALGEVAQRQGDDHARASPAPDRCCAPAARAARLP